MGAGRTDLIIEWPTDSKQSFFGEVQRIVIELKIRHEKQKLESIIEQGLAQTAQYADRLNAEEAHLIIFNRNPEMSWEEKIWQKIARAQQREIHIWGC